MTEHCPLNILCKRCIVRSDKISELIRDFQLSDKPILKFTNCLPSDYIAIVSWCNVRANYTTKLIIDDSLTITYTNYKQLQFNDMVSGCTDYNDELIAISHAKKIYITQNKL
jgi:hypothetical protein